ncbi:MAG: hypothetical protein ACLVKO_10880 [Dysgonomonas sp.]
MKRYIIYLAVVLFTCVGSVSMYAAENSSDARPVPELRIPPKSEIEKYKDDKAFDYTPAPKTKYPEWIAKTFYWISRALDEALSSLPMRWILISSFVLLLTALIVYLVLRSQGISVKNLFGRKKIDTNTAEFVAEDVNNMDFDRLIENSLKAKDYRLAVRFLYLKNLKALSDYSIIKWNPNKTNYSYQYEINDKNLRSQFLYTTTVFDFVWYGEFLLDEPMFNNLHKQFDAFNRKIENEG